MAAPIFPTVPLRPEQLPQQRLNLVVDLPQRPHGWEGHCECFERIPESLRPKSMPATARYLAMVEWSWSPVHSRVAAWYISANRARSHWLLWEASLDDGGSRWRWDSSLYAWGPKGGVPRETAAIYLLRDALAAEARGFKLDCFHLIGGTGMLGVPQLRAIAREVWPDEEPPEEE